MFFFKWLIRNSIPIKRVLKGSGLVSGLKIREFNEFVVSFFDVTNKLLDDTFNLVFKKFGKNLVTSFMDGYFPGVFEEILPHEHRPFIIFINNFQKTFMNSIWSQNKLFPRFIYFFATFNIVVVQLSKNLFTKMRES